MFETVGCGIGFWLFPRLPCGCLLALSRLAGWFGWIFLGRERRIMLANMDVVFGSRMAWEEKKNIVRRSFQSVARTSLETLAASRLKGAHFENHFEFAPGSLELLKEIIGRKKGLIALTFHYGNWEWLSLAWGMAGYPVTAVAQTIKNPKVEEMFCRVRQQMGTRIIPRHHAGRHLFKALKRGESIGLLVDLNSSVEEGGGFFDFLGLPAMTTRSVGFLALRTGAPVVCSVARPLANGRYRIEIGPEIKVDPQAPVEEEMDRVTCRWLEHCERLVREQPECWMWMYKRWKLRPVPEQGRYPFYSFYDPKACRVLRGKQPHNLLS
ncbi:MAG: lysophospholipid acyltransferase family protein [Verrucomicrobiae bacterium]|nr:lysophospholipid acyltransferase family protein [Verrucomicrobiae bacterium]